MGILGALPKPANLTIFYVSKSFEHYGCSQRLLNVYCNWGDLRYALESCCGAVHNHSTFLRGYTKDSDTKDSDVFTELKHRDTVSGSVYVCRHVMPLGLRQYVPPEQNLSYLKLTEELRVLDLALKDEERRFLEHLNSVDYTNFQTKVDFQRDPSLEKKRSACRASLDVIEQKSGLHASQFEQVPLVFQTHETFYATSYVTPWPTYICQLCLQQGHHFKDACGLFEAKVSKDISFKWGAAKMKKLTSLG